jgi:protein-S-isoprenylcysteine O-methyltransferase Ste14
VIPLDPYLVVRGGSLYLACVLSVAAWLWRRPSARVWSGGVIASLLNVPVLLALNVAASRAGWWTFDARGGLLLGVPVDLLLSWSWLWGAVPALLFPAAPLPFVVSGAIAADLLLMPAAAPVVRLGAWWLAGEGVALALALVPAQLLARWTARGERLGARVALQMIAFVGLVAFVVPAMAIEGSSGRWLNPLSLAPWQLALAAQLVGVPAILGFTAVQEFATRGGGTPVPLDPPRRLVTTGIYAYMRNPMQMSGILVLVALGIVVGNVWVSIAGVMAGCYSAGLAAWVEDRELRERFGEDWTSYARAVRRWVPRLRPWYRTEGEPARLYVAATCGMCSDVAHWFARRRAAGVAIVAAETHPSRALRRITYEAGGSCRVDGIEAVARALEHVHIGWALAGFALRLPIVRATAQLIVDASGGEPRAIPARLAE